MSARRPSAVAAGLLLTVGLAACGSSGSKAAAPTVTVAGSTPTTIAAPAPTVVSGPSAPATIDAEVIGAEQVATEVDATLTNLDQALAEITRAAQDTARNRD